MQDLKISDNCFYEVDKNVIIIESFSLGTFIIPAFETVVVPINLTISLMGDFVLDMIQEDYTIERLQPLVMYGGDKKVIILRDVEYYNLYDYPIILREGDFVTYISLTLK